MQRVILVIAGLVILALMLYVGWSEQLFTAARIKQGILDLGIFGPLAFIAAITLFNPYFVPVITFAIPAGLIWDFYTFFLLIWLGIIGSCIHGFVFARYFARGFVAQRLPAQLKKFDAKITANGFTGTLAVPLILGLMPPAHWLLGLSQVRFIPYLLGSAIGFLPLSLFLAYSISFVGANFDSWFSLLPIEVWALLAIATFVIIISVKKLHRRPI